LQKERAKKTGFLREAQKSPFFLLLFLLKKEKRGLRGGAPSGIILSMECTSAKNKGRCNCTYEPCDKKGKCCLCLGYHRDRGELPACLFNAEYERTYDRSISNFLKMHGAKRT
jgi:hypothetical protein